MSELPQVDAMDALERAQEQAKNADYEAAINEAEGAASLLKAAKAMEDSK